MNHRWDLHKPGHVPYSNDSVFQWSCKLFMPATQDVPSTHNQASHVPITIRSWALDRFERTPRWVAKFAVIRQTEPSTKSHVSGFSPAVPAIDNCHPCPHFSSSFYSQTSIKHFSHLVVLRNCGTAVESRIRKPGSAMSLDCYGMSSPKPDDSQFL